jgi:hypothetical protein
LDESGAIEIVAQAMEVESRRRHTGWDTVVVGCRSDAGLDLGIQLGDGQFEAAKQV